MQNRVMAFNKIRCFSSSSKIFVWNLYINSAWLSKQDQIVALEKKIKQKSGTMSLRFQTMILQPICLYPNKEIYRFCCKTLNKLNFV